MRRIMACSALGAAAIYVYLRLLSFGTGWHLSEIEANAYSVILLGGLTTLASFGVWSWRHRTPHQAPCAEVEPSKMRELSAQKIVLLWLAPSRLDFVYDPVIDVNGQLSAVHAKLRLRREDGALLNPFPLLMACDTLGIRSEIDHYILTRAQIPLLALVDELPPLHVVISLDASSVAPYNFAAHLSAHAQHMPYPVALASLENAQLGDAATNLPPTNEFFVLEQPDIQVLLQNQSHPERQQLCQTLTEAKARGQLVAATQIRNKAELNALINAGVDFFHGKCIGKNLGVSDLLNFVHHPPFDARSVLFERRKMPR